MSEEIERAVSRSRRRIDELRLTRLERESLEEDLAMLAQIMLQREKVISQMEDTISDLRSRLSKKEARENTEC